MLKSVHAKVYENGEVRLLEPLDVQGTCNAIITILDEGEVPETALLSEESLAGDWERPEEEEAWKHLQ